MSDNRNQLPSFAIAPQRGPGFSDPPPTQRDGEAGAESACARREKKPYRKPSYRFERVFETMALSCGKKSPVEFQCRFNRRNS